MQVYRGMLSVREAQSVFSSAELRRLVGRRIKELIDYTDFDDPTIFRVIVLEPTNEVAALNGVLGFSLFERRCDVIESHEEWFELTLVLSDDGVGVIIYIPKSLSVDPSLLSYCHTQMELLSS